MKSWHIVTVAAVVASLAEATPMNAQRPKLTSELEQVRAALQKYDDPITAIHDGYFSTLGCVEYPEPGGAGHAPYPGGGMGVHFLNASLIGQPLDPLKPTVLLYEPEGNRLRLVAVEWFVPLATGVKQRPKLFGAEFDGPMEGHHPLMPLGLHHYDLHVWLFKDNPVGLFRPTNPAVKCGAYPFSFSQHPPKLVSHQ